MINIIYCFVSGDVTRHHIPSLSLSLISFPLYLKNNKERFIAAIDYLNKNLTKEQLIQILNKSKKLSDERYVTNS